MDFPEGAWLNALFSGGPVIRLTALVLVSFHAGALAAPGACDFSSAREVLAQNKNEMTVRWELPKSAELEAPFVPSRKRDLDYAKWVKSNKAPSPKAVMRKAIQLREDFLRDHGTDDGGTASFKKEIANIRRVLDDGAGRIRPMSCLESIPFREQLDFADLRGHAFEFMASIYEKDGRYLVVANFDRRTNGGTAPSKAALKEEKRLKTVGWRYAIHLHNHPFVFDNPYGDIGGTLVPSLPDFATYQETRPSKALVTNGLESIELVEDEYLGFERY